MKLDEKQMDAAFDALTIEARAERQRTDLLQQKKEIGNPPLSWRIGSALFAIIFFTVFWFFVPELKLLGAAAAIMAIFSGRWLWRKKVSDQIKGIEYQIKAIRY